MSTQSRQPGTDERRFELLERSELLGALGAALEEAAAGRGRMILLGGEAGAGKTSLVREFCSQNASARVLWGACERLFAPRAPGPFLDIVDAVGVELGDFAPHRRVPYELVGVLIAELRRERLTVLRSPSSTATTSTRHAHTRTLRPARSGRASTPPPTGV